MIFSKCTIVCNESLGAGSSSQFYIIDIRVVTFRNNLNPILAVLNNFVQVKYEDHKKITKTLNFVLGIGNLKKKLNMLYELLKLILAQFEM